MLFPSAEGARPPTPPSEENNSGGTTTTTGKKNNNTDSFDFSNSPKDKSSVLNLNKHFMASSQSLRKDKPTPPASPRLEKSSFENMSTDGEYASASEGEEISTATTSPGNLSNIEFPFLRALHTFDPVSLPNTSTEDPVSICLKFEQGDVALLHSVHDSGWGDATLLPTSRRGWIPTNYFTTYSDPKVASLLTAILNFVLNPKSLQIAGKFDSRHTFSQEAITAIVAGVRSLLETCGTLTRDTATVKKSQMIRRFRKNLLAELAILVSLAKQHRNSTDEAVIERLVNGCYKIASKAVLFLDVWAMDNNNEQEYVTTNQRQSISHHSPQNSVDTATAAMPPPPPPRGSENRNSMSTLAPSISQSTVVTPGTMLDSNQHTNDSNFAIPRAPRGRTEKNANRESVIFLSQAPTAKQRLDEVNDALTAYLGIFIHRMGFLESDSSASTQILVNTRKSMLACRELLAAVESISFKQLPRNRELEQTKDKLFGQIRGLVTAARDVVANSAAAANSNDQQAEISNAGKKLISIATDCARTAGECVVRCRIILDKVGDFQMPSDREYPDFSDGVIAIPNYRVKGKELSLIAPSYLNTPSPASPTFPQSVYNDMPQSAASEFAPRTTTTLEVPQQQQHDDENSSNMLPEIPSLSPIITAKSAETSPSEPTFQAGTTYLDSNNNQAPGTSSGGEEAEPEEEPEVVVDGSEYPADLQVIKDETTGKIRAGSLRVMIDMLTDENKLQDPFLLSTFFLTFRLYSTPQEVVDCLVDRYGLDVDEDQLVLQDLEDISSRRIKVYTMFKRWLESHWKQSIDGPVLDQILDLADNHFAKVLPNSKTIIHDLASKVTSDLLEDGEPIVPRVLSLPNGKPAKSGSGRDSIIHQITLSKNMITALHRLIEVNGYKPWNSANPLDSEETTEDETQRRRDMNLQSTTTNGTTNSFITNGHPPTLHNHNAPSADTRSIHTTTSSTWSSSFRIVRNSTFNVSANAINPPPLSIMDFEPLEIAAQLTLMDSNMFAKLEPAELLGRNFEKKRKIRQAPHVAMMATFMNQLSSFVGHTVLGGDLPTKQRKNVLKQWIKIAEKCLELKNYNSLIGIVSVLQSVNIIRLKKTWETLSPRYHTIFNHLKEISSPERNFAGYRQQIRVQETPCVPFLGVYLSDLTFLVEGNARTRKFHHPDSPNKVIKVINFDLYERISKIVAEIQKFQVPYTKLTSAKELQTWLHGEMIKSHAQVSKGDELWRRSCIVEPKAH
jgi:hypothetical protein